MIQFYLTFIAILLECMHYAGEMKERKKKLYSFPCWTKAKSVENNLIDTKCESEIMWKCAVFILAQYPAGEVATVSCQYLIKYHAWEPTHEYRK